jgi:CMP-N-acetylneuraminic acid synthetase
MSPGDQELLGLIPARSGSKGLPHKNILPLAGKPMIAWTVQAALQSQSITRVVVTTNDWMIARIAQQWGADVPFLRPQEMAQDHSDPADAIFHALDWLETKQQYLPDAVMLLQPTSPLRSSQDIDGAARAMVREDAESVVSVGPVHQPPALMRRLDDRGRLRPIAPTEPAAGRRQDFEETYLLNGAIYLARRHALFEHRRFTTDQSYGFIMPPERSVDIDTEWDYRLAQVLAGALDHERPVHRLPPAGTEQPMLHCC